MLSCTNCGEEITDIQHQDFSGLCPACVRGDKTRKRRGGTSLICIGIYILIPMFSTFLTFLFFMPFITLFFIPFLLIPLLMIIFGYKRRKQFVQKNKKIQFSKSERDA